MVEGKSDLYQETQIMYAQSTAISNFPLIPVLATGLSMLFKCPFIIVTLIFTIIKKFF